jgi:hemerythrin superfamily protein
MLLAAGLGPRQREVDGMRPAQDLLHVLARDHRRLDERARSLLDDAARRTPQAVRGFATDVLAHEASEQLLLHPLVTERVLGGARLARRRTEEEDALERHLRLAMDETPTSAGFTARLRMFHTAFVEHTDREELEVFPALRHVVSRSALRELGRTYASLAVRLPTRLRCAVGANAGSDDDGVGCRLAEVRAVAGELLEEVGVPAVISLPEPEVSVRRGATRPDPRGFAGQL